MTINRSIWIGYDPREHAAALVCERSLIATAAGELPPIRRLELKALRDAGIYHREEYTRDGQRYDARDDSPFSTDFSFSRFLVPALELYAHGFALFMDSDFLWCDDVAGVFAQADPRYAVQVVKHDFAPEPGRKMRGALQQPYPRKNWSSLILWNCDHPSNRKLTGGVVSMAAGRFLHGFGWLADDEIGDLDPRWNVLEGIDPQCAITAAGAIHYTRGTPDMPGYENAAHARRWYAFAQIQDPLL